MCTKLRVIFSKVNVNFDGSSIGTKDQSDCNNCLVGKISLSLSEGVSFAGGIIQITLLGALVALSSEINYFLIFFSIITTLSPLLDGGVAIHKK